MKQDEGLLHRLTEYSHSDYYPFHMPGHKRASLDFPNPWSIDITEIEGFDNLHHADGILEALQQEAARLFKAQRSFCLVNGSTCGLLSAISACVRPGGKLLMSRNCHKSVYNAVYLRNITPVYLMPEMTEFGIMGSLSLDAVKKALQEHPDADALLIVSPTYDGIVSNIKDIAQIAHAHNIPLIVDEAHGAHFPFSDYFPLSALAGDADIVIHSLHKTLPAFTQTALLHVNSSRVDEAAIVRFLGIYQSSSPSYLLLSSMDRCMEIIQKNGAELFGVLAKNLDEFYQKCRMLQYIQVFEGNNEPSSALFSRDVSKILISATSLGLSGQDLYDILLNQYHIQLEMASGHYGLALSSLMDTKEGFLRLFEALSDIEKRYTKQQDRSLDSKTLYRIPEQAVTIAQALEQPGTWVPLAESTGAISREYLYLYPPGIPLIAPGEIIDADLLENICRLKDAGLRLEGLADRTNTRINIVNF